MSSPVQRPVRKTDQLICEEVSGECVIYDGRQKKVHHLNPTLTWIWNRCDGHSSIETMAEAFSRHFQVNGGLDVILTGLDRLDGCDLLEKPVFLAEAVAAERSAVSRRAVLVGGSVVMPLVVSILAPTPAAAKSSDPKIDREKIKEKIGDVKDTLNKIKEKIKDRRD